MTDLTRTSPVAVRGVVEGYSASGSGGSWSERFSIGKELTNSVTFSPYTIPNYRRHISEGSQATTRMDAVRHTVEAGQFMDFAEERKFTPPTDRFAIGLRGSLVAFLPQPAPSTTDIGRANDLALGQFAQSVSQALSQFQTGTFLGELGEAIHMVRHPAESLLRGVHSYLRNTRSVASKFSKPHLKRKAIAGSWLEYSYGWAPLVSDIRNAAKALAEVTSHRLPRKNVSGKGSDSDRGPLIHDHEIYGPIRRDVTYMRKSSVEVRIYGQVLTKTSPVGGALQTFGLDSFTGFIPQLWELIPYSFLVDYFTNVGSIIYAASNPLGSVSWVNRGILSTDGHYLVESKGSYIPQNNPEFNVTADSHSPSGSASWVKETRVREAYSGSYIPSLRFHVPGSGLKWLNIGALGIAHSRAVSALR